MTIPLETIVIFVLLTPFAVIAIGGYLYFLALQLFQKVRTIVQGKKTKTERIEVKTNGI